MKAEITVNGTKYVAEYNAARGVFGFDSRDEFYNVFIENEAPIMRAISRAEDDDSFKHELTTKSGNVIAVELFPLS